MNYLLHCNGKKLDLKKVQVVGILNLTPDSFSDGGCYNTREKALKQADRMLSEGAKVLDIGGESTRPGAKSVSVQRELDRTIDIIESIAERFDAVLSIDTQKAAVMQAACEAGVDMINDVRALQNEGAMAVAAKYQVVVCLMHMQKTPATMQQAPYYRNLIGEVQDFFTRRISACEQAGIAKNRLILDPGIGFGKTVSDNLTLINRLDQFKVNHLPLLVGISRKSMIASVTNIAAKITTGAEINERMPGSLAASVMAVVKGAHLVRTHDVKQTVQAIAMASAIIQERCGE